MKRRLFNLAAGISLLLFVAVGVLWVRGGGGRLEMIDIRYGRLPRADEYHAFYFKAQSYSGTLRFSLIIQNLDPRYFRGRSAQWMNEFLAAWRTGFHCTIPSEIATMIMSREMPGFDAGLYVYSSWIGDHERSWILAVGNWLPMLLLLVLPAIWLNRFRKTRRARRQGLCPGCRYDLRASPERCPECGLPAKSSRKNIVTPMSSSRDED